MQTIEIALIASHFCLALVFAFCSLMTKFRYRKRESYVDIKARTLLTSIFSLFSIVMLIFFLGANLDKFQTISVVDWINIFFLLILLTIGKFSSHVVDKAYPQIVRAREPRDYNLIRQWVTLVCGVYTLLAIIMFSDNPVPTFLFMLYPAFLIINEIWERAFALRFLLIAHTETVTNPRIKYMLHDHSNKFWLREITGNIIKSTINCWISFALILLIVKKIYGNGFLVTEREVEIQFGITSSFYVAASEMFFNSSGYFASSEAAQIVYFLMHIVGVFLYGVFFVIGAQAFIQTDE